MMTAREKEILSKTIDILKKYVNPQTIYLFGSRQNGTPRKGSDFDFAVTGPRPEFKIQKEIDAALNEFTGLYKIDIIYLESVDNDFTELILQQGRIVYEKRI